MENSASLKELIKALIAFQAKAPKIEKNKEGYGYKYASLELLLEKLQPVLLSNGLVITQTFQPGVNEKSVLIHTKLMHVSGEWIGSNLLMHSDKVGPQAIGSCITYARRYSVLAILNIAPEEDDDAAKAQATPLKEQKSINDKAKEFF